MKKNYFAHKSILSLIVIVFITIIAVLSTIFLGSVAIDSVNYGYSKYETENTATIYGDDIPEYDGTVSDEVQSKYDELLAAGEKWYSSSIDIQYSPTEEFINQNRAGTFNEPYYIDSVEQFVKVLQNAYSLNTSVAAYNTNDTYFVLRNDLDFSQKLYSAIINDTTIIHNVYFNLSGYDYTQIPGYQNFATSTGVSANGKNYSNPSHPFVAVNEYLKDSGLTEDVSSIGESGNNFKTIRNLYFDGDFNIGLFSSLSGDVLGLNIYNAYYYVSDENRVYVYNLGGLSAKSGADIYVLSVNIKGLTFSLKGIGSSGNGCGGVIGSLQSSVVFDNVEFEGAVINKVDNVAGMVGYTHTGCSVSFTDCKVYGNVTGESKVGGFLGRCRGGSTGPSFIFSGENHNYAKIVSINESNSGSYAGGFIADLESGAELHISGINKNFGEIECGMNYAGGLIGYVNAVTEIIFKGVIENHGNVNAAGGYAGGIFAYNIGSEKFLISGTLNNTGDISSGTQHAGGIFSSLYFNYNSENILDGNFSNSGKIYTDSIAAAGIIGYVSILSTDITLSGNFENNGQIQQTGNNISGFCGGIIGQCFSDGYSNNIIISGSAINYGKIIGSSTSKTGGIIGYLNCYAAEITGSVKNCGEINGYDSVGGIIGNSNCVSLTLSSQNTGSVTGYGSGVGGIIGNLSFDFAKIYDSVNGSYTGEINDIQRYNDPNASITGGNSGVGGIVGSFNFAKNSDAYRNFQTINCHNFMEINCSDSFISGAGGILGSTTSESKNVSFNFSVNSCVNHADINGHDSNYIAGVIASAHSYTFTVSNCINYGTVCGNSNVAGILAYNKFGDTVQINGCENNGLICAKTQKAAGILSEVYDNSKEIVIEDCVNNASIYLSNTVFEAGKDKPSGGVYTYKEAIALSENLSVNGFVGGILAYYNEQVTKLTVRNCVNGSINTDNEIISNFLCNGGIVGGNKTSTYTANIILEKNINYMSITGAGYTGGLYGCITGNLQLMIGNIDIENEGYGNYADLYSFNNVKNYTDTGSIAGGIQGYLELVGDNAYKNSNNITVNGTSVGGIIGSLKGTGSNTVTLNAVWGNEGEIRLEKNKGGGIIGNLNSVGSLVISNTLFNKGNIINSGMVDQTGGLIGVANGSVTFKALVYNEGNVYSTLQTSTSSLTSADGSIGGIIGYAQNSVEFIEGAEGSYNSGIIYGNCKFVGGIIGRINGTFYLKGVESRENNTISGGGNFVITIYPSGSSVGNNVSIIATVQCDSQVGGLIGISFGDSGSFIDCVNNSSVYATGSDVAGLLGQGNYLTNFRIQNCANYGSITTRDSWVGGFVGGSPMAAIVVDSANHGKISCLLGQNIGGMFAALGNVGYTLYSVSFVNSYNDGEIYGPKCAGGIVGIIRAALDVTFTDCYNKGNIVFDSTSSFALESFGGIIGQINTISEVVLDGCYVECDTIGNSSVKKSGGIIGCVKLTKAGTVSIQNCYTDVKNIYASVDIGAAVGYISSTINLATYFNITDSYFAGESINGGYNAGGILGYTKSFKGITIERVACLYDKIEVSSFSTEVSGIMQSLYDVCGSVVIKDVYITSDLVSVNGEGDASLFTGLLVFNSDYNAMSLIIKNVYLSGTVSAKAVNYFGAINNYSSDTSYTKTLSVHNTYVKNLSSSSKFNVIGGTSSRPSTSASKFNPSSINICDYEFGAGTDNLFVNYNDLKDIDNFEGWGVTEDTRSGNADTSVTPWGIDPAVNDGKPFLIVATCKNMTIYYDNSGDDLDIFDNSIRNSDEMEEETVANIITYYSDTVSYNDIKNGKSNYSDNPDYIGEIKRVGYTVKDIYKQRLEDGSYSESDKYTEISAESPNSILTVKNDIVFYITYNTIEYTVAVADNGAVFINGTDNYKITLENIGDIYLSNNNNGQSSPFVYFALEKANGQFDAVGENAMELISGSGLSAVYNLYLKDFVNQQIIYTYARSVSGNYTIFFKAMFVEIYKVTFTLSEKTYPSFITVSNSSGIAVNFGSAASIEAGIGETYNFSITKHYELVKIVDKSLGSVVQEGSSNGYTFNSANMTLTINNTTGGQEYEFEIYVQAVEYTIQYKLYNSVGDLIDPDGDITLAVSSAVVKVDTLSPTQNISVSPNSAYVFLNYRYRYYENGKEKTEIIDTQGSTVLNSVICSSSFLDKYVYNKTITIEIVFESNALLSVSISNIMDWDSDYGSVIVNIFNDNGSLISSKTLSLLSYEYSESFDLGCTIEIVLNPNRHFKTTFLSVNDDTLQSDGEIIFVLDSSKSVNVEFDYIEYYFTFVVFDENQMEIEGAADEISLALDSGADYITARGDNVTATISEIFGYGFNAWGIYYMGEFFEFDSSEFSTDGTLNNALISVEDLDNYLDEYNQITIACRLYTLFDLDVVLADTDSNLGKFEIYIFNDILGHYNDPISADELESMPYLTRIKITAIPGDYYDFREFIGLSESEISSDSVGTAEFYLTESKTVMLSFDAKSIATSVLEDLSNATGELLITNSSGNPDSWKAGDTLSFTFKGAFGQEINSFTFNGIDAKELSLNYDNITYVKGVLTITMTADFLDTLQNNDFTISISSQIGTVYLIMLLSIIIIPILLTVMILIFVIINIKRRKRAMEIIYQRKNSMARFEASNMISELKKGTYQQVDRSVSKEEIERQLRADKESKK